MAIAPGMINGEQEHPPSSSHPELPSRCGRMLLSPCSALVCGYRVQIPSGAEPRLCQHQQTEMCEWLPGASTKDVEHLFATSPKSR